MPVEFWVLCIFWTEVSYQICVSQVFHPVCGLSFILRYIAFKGILSLKSKSGIKETKKHPLLHLPQLVLKTYYCMYVSSSGSNSNNYLTSDNATIKVCVYMNVTSFDVGLLLESQSWVNLPGLEPMFLNFRFDILSILSQWLLSLQFYICLFLIITQLINICVHWKVRVSSLVF